MRWRKSLFLKSSILLIGVFVIATIVPNSQIVFGYGGGVSPASAPTCGNVKPGGAPYLQSATPVGNNAVMLRWSAAIDPVTYYLVTFGTKPGEQLYGNPNVGDRETTSYLVSGLPGGRRFYFKVRAGNGCQPGSYSNEVSAITRGVALGGVPAGFQAGVLGAKITASPLPTSNPIATPSPTPLAIPSTCKGFFGRLFCFLRGLFSH